MIENMLSGIHVELDVDYLKDKKEWDKKAKTVVYTGPIDAYFDFCFGPLQYRSVRFEEIQLNISNYQGNAVVNYTDRDIPWTRIIEHKWFEFGRDNNGNEFPYTIISKEYSSEWKVGEDVYYPVNDATNGKKFYMYKRLANEEKNILFGGRLADYKYYDMD